MSQQRLKIDETQRKDALWDQIENIDGQDHFALAFHKRFEKQLTVVDVEPKIEENNHNYETTDVAFLETNEHYSKKDFQSLPLRAKAMSKIITSI